MHLCSVFLCFTRFIDHSRMPSLSCILLVVCLTFSCINWTNANKYNISYNELQFCKEYAAVSGYTYNDYFHIDSFRQNVSNVDDIINLNLYVLTAKDALILLTPDDTNKTAPVYEIVIGAGGNTFSEIRRQRQKQQLKSVRMKGFLSAIEVVPLTIRVVRNGTISVSVTGQKSPFIAYNDTDVINVQYISFSTWGTNEVKWFYDCDNSSGNRLTRIKQKPKSLDQLQKDLFEEYDISVAPINLSSIALDFNVNTVEYNAKKSILITKGRLKAAWNDARLRWRPKDYNNTAVFHLEDVIANSHPWNPTMHLLNSRDESFIMLPTTYKLSVLSNGAVYAESNELQFSTWCSNTNSDWPYEQIECNILAQLKQSEEIAIRVMNIKDNLSVFKSEQQQRIDFEGDEWHIVWKKVSAIERTSVNASLGHAENALLRKSMLQITVNIKRNSVLIKHLFFTPLYGTFLLVLMSFWLTRYLRLTLILISIFVLIMVQLVLVDHAPPNYTPSIVYFYTGLTFIAGLCLIIFVMSCWLERFQHIPIKQLCGLEHFFGHSSISYDQTKFDDENVNESAIVLDRVAFFALSLVFLGFLCFAQ